MTASFTPIHANCLDASSYTCVPRMRFAITHSHEPAGHARMPCVTGHGGSRNALHAAANRAEGRC